MKFNKLILFCFFLSFLSACKKDMTDLDKFFADAKLVPIKQIEPLPEINSPEVFVYRAEDNRDPFSNDLQMLNVLEVEDETSNENNEGPDRNRRKEILENFPLDGLVMVGTYQQDNDFWGLIEDPEGVIHRVKTTEHMGQNYGEISSINEDEISLSEWVADGLGGWLKREASIALREE